MRLSKLYCNQPDLFGPISFHPGLNVVRGEIRLPENKDRDTHNLGKSLLGRVIDFTLLSGTNQQMFLIRHKNLFAGFIFFLEVEISSSRFVTIRRSVSEPSKASFALHQLGQQDFSTASEDDWDHLNQPAERSRELLNAILELRALSPWGLRKGLGYQLRTQDDYRDVFKLNRFGGAHSDWKPYVSHILGLNSSLISERYQKEEQIKKTLQTLNLLKSELGEGRDDISKVEGLLLLKREDVNRKQAILDSVDFSVQDHAINQVIVNDLDHQIATLNRQNYAASFNAKKINDSLQNEIVGFDSSEAARLFAEAGVVFTGQIRRTFDQLVEFNRAIAEERSGYLRQELDDINAEVRSISQQLNGLNRQRAEALSFLRESNFFQKYRDLSEEMIKLRADVIVLDGQRSSLQRLQQLRETVRETQDELSHLDTLLERNVEITNADPENVLSRIRRLFNQLVERVIDRKALLTVSLNNENHPVFDAQILDDDETPTSAVQGHTYKKLLCIAFDLAIIAAHEDEGFPRFVYHDGVFESLDDRKKLRLVEDMRRYAENGIQQIITLIDSEEPKLPDGIDLFDETEVIVRLHDQGQDGRLFRMPSW